VGILLVLTKRGAPICFHGSLFGEPTRVLAAADADQESKKEENEKDPPWPTQRQYGDHGVLLSRLVFPLVGNCMASNLVSAGNGRKCSDGSTASELPHEVKSLTEDRNAFTKNQVETMGEPNRLCCVSSVASSRMPSCSLSPATSSSA
jgi:hypothetical protein